jgi:HEPN domain-containing protein
MSTRPIGWLEPRRHLAPEESDPAFAQKRRRFLDGLERAIAEANREIIGRTLAPGEGNCFERETFLRLAVRVAELRAHYIAEGLAVAAGHPDPPAIERLAQARRAFEEMREVFEAVERVVERGYVDLPGHGSAREPAPEVETPATGGPA